MQPLPRITAANGASENLPVGNAVLLASALLTMGAWTLGCGGGGAGSVAPPSPPPPSISVNITPESGTVLLGETLGFTAVVSNASDTAVMWSVNGVSGGSAQGGTITTDGIYTAPVDLPPGGTVQVTATSQADPSKSATAKVTVVSDISVSLSPSTANVELGAKQSFLAAVQSQGRPDTAIRWSVSGIGCPSACGTLYANGGYVAPQILPSSTTVSLIATSVADPSKQNTATLTITSHFTLQLSAPANLGPGAITTLVAVLAPVAGSDPSEALSWALSGSGCTGGACGSLNVTTTQSAGGAPLENTAVYIAPQVPPQPDSVVITVTPVADPSKQVQATIAIQGSAGIGISPANTTVAVNGRVTFTALEGGTSGGSLNWSVNGIPGGNSTFGQICVTDSNPCQPLAGGTTTQVDYLAPAVVSSPNPLSLTVSSAANPGLSASAEITIIGHVVVSVVPSSVSLPPLGVQSFSASVLGSKNQTVFWEIQGPGCGTSGSCGSINSSGNYTAPGTPPTPNTLQVVATSQFDATRSGTANVTISNQLQILAVHPASVYAGGVDGFILQVDGSGFVPSSAGLASVLVIGGSPRVTSCASAAVCTAAVTSADVAQAGSLNVQVQNSNADISNTVTLVIVAPGIADGTVSLSSAAPLATGKDIVAVEPTTAGVDTLGDDVDLDIAAIGVFNTSDNSCNLGGNAIRLNRPANGATTADICLFSQSGLDPSMSYTVSGPGDVMVISRQPTGLGIVRLTLQIPATAAPGPRTLFVQNPNLDKTSASGVLVVQ